MFTTVTTKEAAMHPEIERQMAMQRVEELRRAGAIARLRAATPRSVREKSDVVIRSARPEDTLALHALAVLDEAEAPIGRVLVAEVDGEIRAALPLDGSPAIGDPFRRTADLVALLEARALQIKGEPAEAGRGRMAWLSAATLRKLV
jgi:hypothetical protein